MRDAKRINDVLSVIGTVWVKNPDLRLGQLICNAVPENKNLYNLEEYELVQYLLEHYKQCFKKETDATTENENKTTNKINESVSSDKNTNAPSIRIKELDEFLTYQSEFNTVVMDSIRSLIFSNPFACSTDKLEHLEWNNYKIKKLKGDN